MVAQFLGLKLRLLANIFRRSPFQIVGIVIALLYGLGAAFFVITGLFALRFVPVELAGNIVVTFGSVLVLGFLLIPLAFGVDDTIDPRKFALFGISTSRLAAGLAVSALVGVPSIVITIISIAQVVTWSRGALPIILAIVSAVVVVVTCVLGARVTTSVAAFVFSSRRARETSGLIGILVLILLSPVIVILTTIDWGRDGLAVLAGVARVAGWTPLGAAWAAPADAASGAVGSAIAKMFIGIAFAGLLWLAWRALVGKMLVTPHREPQGKREVGLGWFGRFPDTAAGAIAGRSMIYWFRDSRYRISLVMIPIVPILLVVPLLTVGIWWQNLMLLPLPVMCLFLTWSIHNDVAYDNSAIWLHVASNTSGWADRIGRVAPLLIFGLPLVLIGSPIFVWLYGDWTVLPSLLGLSLCLLGAGLGFSSIISARFPYPAPRPGDSPFVQPQSTGTLSALVQGLSFFAILIISLPVLALGILGLLFGGWWGFIALAVGVVIGGLGFYFGLLWGGKIFDRRAPELLAFTLRN